MDDDATTTSQLRSQLPQNGEATAGADEQPVRINDDFSCFVGDEREARIIYQEIYEDHCYDFAELGPSAFIVDVGANIGLFTLYMRERYPSATILAFEPAPQNFATLLRNLELHGMSSSSSGVDARACALGSEEGTAVLTYYPNAPGNSTFVPDEKDQLREKLPSDFHQRMLDRLVRGAVTVPVPVRRLSSILDDDYAGLARIDLLKLDCESAELDVLRGVADEHWGLVQNMAVEVSGISGLLGELEALLAVKGFDVRREVADWSPEESPMYMLYATRGRSGGK